MEIQHNTAEPEIRSEQHEVPRATWRSRIARILSFGLLGNQGEKPPQDETSPSLYTTSVDDDVSSQPEVRMDDSGELLDSSGNIIWDNGRWGK